MLSAFYTNNDRKRRGIATRDKTIQDKTDRHTDRQTDRQTDTDKQTEGEEKRAKERDRRLQCSWLIGDKSSKT